MSRPVRLTIVWRLEESNSEPADPDLAAGQPCPLSRPCHCNNLQTDWKRDYLFQIESGYKLTRSVLSLVWGWNIFLLYNIYIGLLMFYFPDLCALGPEILGEHSLSFSSYLHYPDFLGNSPRCPGNKEMCNSDSSAWRLIPCLIPCHVSVVKISVIWSLLARVPALSQGLRLITRRWLPRPGWHATCQC